MGVGAGGEGKELACALSPFALFFFLACVFFFLLRPSLPLFLSLAFYSNPLVYRVRCVRQRDDGWGGFPRPRWGEGRKGSRQGVRLFTAVCDTPAYPNRKNKLGDGCLCTVVEARSPGSGLSAPFFLILSGSGSSAQARHGLQKQRRRRVTFVFSPIGYMCIKREIDGERGAGVNPYHIQRWW